MLLEWSRVGYGWGLLKLRTGTSDAPSEVMDV